VEDSVGGRRVVEDSGGSPWPLSSFGKALKLCEALFQVSY
jgi:hypothetical protein